LAAEEFAGAERPVNAPLSMITRPRESTVFVTPFTRIPSNME
jgi:hypothetical protein